MNDKQILILLRSVLLTGLQNNGFPNVQVLRGYQVTQQGVPTNPTIYLHKVNTERYGHRGVKDVYNSDNDNFDEQIRFIETPVWQITARMQESTDVTAMTAGDLINVAADILEFPATRQTLLNSGVGMEKVSDIRNIYEVNEKEENEHIPNFDLTLNYSKIYNTTVVSVEDIDINLHGI